MSRGLKIFACIMVFLGVLSLIFLLTARNKKQTVSAQHTSQATKKTAPVKKISTSQNNQDSSQAKLQANKTLIRSQWQQCKNKTITANTNLFWNVQISEAIPQGGTYAKGNLDSDSAYPVRVIIKSGIQNADKIKQVLIVGKTPLIRGTCTDVATDGSVVLQAF